MAGFRPIRGLRIKMARGIRQTLVWALVRGMFALPAAAFGFLPPWAAMIGITVTVLFVVSNSMRLMYRQGPHQGPHQGATSYSIARAAE